MIKNVLIILFLIVIANFIGKEANASFVYHSAYWGGCVQGMVSKHGKTFGKNAEFCKDLAQKKTFNEVDFQKVQQTIEEASSLFFEGCSHSEASAETCHSLTKSFHKDITEITSQEPKANNNDK